MKKQAITILITIWGLSAILATEAPKETVLKLLPEKEPAASPGREVSFKARSGGYFMELPGLGGFGGFSLFMSSRIPLRFLPGLGVVIEGGMIQLFSSEPVSPFSTGEMDHLHLTGGGGLSWRHRLSPFLTVGLEGGVKYSYAWFLKVGNTLGGAARGSSFLLAEGGGCFDLNLQEGMDIGLRPGIACFFNLDGIKELTAPAGVLELTLRLEGKIFNKKKNPPILEFGEVWVDDLFAGLQGYYHQEPVGFAIVRSVSGKKVEDLELFYFQSRFMDSPSRSNLVVDLEGEGEEKRFPLYAILNGEIFNLGGPVPLTGEIIARFRMDGEKQEIKYNIPTITLYNKSAICWDDDRKAAAYITPGEDRVNRFAGMSRKINREVTLPSLNQPFQAALQIYHTLKEAGLSYAPDPVYPGRRRGETRLDWIKLPGETLEERLGDCEDLTVLFCSLLEAQGVETGFVTTEDHIIPIFNTGLELEKYRELHPSWDMFVGKKGRLWIPLEITLVGKGEFITAWQEAVDLYGDQEEPRIYLTREAWEKYSPISFSYEGWEPALVEEDPIHQRVTLEIRELGQNVTAFFLGNADTPRRLNDLGFIFFQFGSYDEAEVTFREALARDPSYLLPAYNLAKLLIQKGAYSRALEIFESLLEPAPRGEEIITDIKLYRDSIYKGLTFCYRKTGNPEMADYYYSLIIRGRKKTGAPGEGGLKSSEGKILDFDFILEEDRE